MPWQPEIRISDRCRPAALLLAVCLALSAWPCPAQSEYPTTTTGKADWLVPEQPADGSAIQFDNPANAANTPAEEEFYKQQIVGPEVGSCPPGCSAFWYAQAEALYMVRNLPDRTQITANLSMQDFDYQPGVRATIGRQADCLDAWEVTYTGIHEWSQFQSIMGAGLNSLFTQPTFTFNNATAQSFLYDSKFHSLEVNHRQWGWDILSTAVGFRYIRLDEDFRLSSTSGFGNGFYNTSTTNDLFGFQVGGDVYYPLGQRLSVGGRGKFGLYWNHIEGSQAISDGPGGSTASSGTKDDVSFTIEFGLLATYRVSPRASIKIGYEVWYLWNVALASDQLDYNLQDFSQINESGDILISGATAGFEFQW